MKKLLLKVLCTVMFLSGCTSVNVKPLDSSLAITKVCIEKNEKVIVPQFMDILRAGFDRHGLATEVFPSKPPVTCQVVLTYTALRSWDFTPYLSHAELWLRDSNGRQIAYAEYHLKGKGGFALNKWASTKSKMDPVIDELLAEY
ncbi:MAG: Sbal_3080 family lipoprotein [Pseudomonadota bacterium]